MTFPSIALIAKPISHQVSITGKLERALKARGYRTRASFDLSAPEAVVFCWSWGKAVTVREKNPRAIICCIDHGYTRERGSFVNTGWSLPAVPCGLNGFAEHAVVDDGGVRARAMGWDTELRRYRPTGQRRAVICGQVYGDAMIVGHVADYTQWLHDVRDGLVAEGYTTVFRPHPVMVRRGNARERYGNMGPESPHKDLWTDLAEADLAVGLSSNAVTQAFVDGIDARIYNHGSMLAPIVPQMGTNVPTEYRERWFHRLAWAQWTHDEVADGEWAKWHLPIMHRLWETGELRPWHSQRIP